MENSENQDLQVLDLKIDKARRLIQSLQTDLKADPDQGVGDEGDDALQERFSADNEGALIRVEQELEALLQQRQRIIDGVRVKCAECLKPIPKARLEFVPGAVYCAPCQALSEKGDLPSQIRAREAARAAKEKEDRRKKGKGKRDEKTPPTDFSALDERNTKDRLTSSDFDRFRR